MNEERIIEDSYLFGHSLSMLAQEIEQDEFIQFIDLSERAKQCIALEGRNREKFVINLESEFKVPEEDIELLVNLEDGILSKMIEGIKKLIKKIVSFLKKIFFFWKKNPPDEKKIKELTVNDVKEKLLKNMRLAIKADLKDKLNIGYSTIANTAQLINKYVEGDLKAKGDDIYKYIVETNKEIILEEIEKYVPNEKKFIFFRKSIVVNIEVLPLNVVITNVEEDGDTLRYEFDLTGTLVIRDTKQNILGIQNIHLKTNESFGKKDIDKLAKIEYEKIKNIKKSYMLMESLLKDIESIDKTIDKMSKSPEDSKIWKTLISLGYEDIKPSYVIKHLSIASKQLVSVAKACSDDLKEAVKILS